MLKGFEKNYVQERPSDLPLKVIKTSCQTSRAYLEGRYVLVSHTPETTRTGLTAVSCLLHCACILFMPSIFPRFSTFHQTYHSHTQISLLGGLHFLTKTPLLCKTHNKKMCMYLLSFVTLSHVTGPWPRT